MREEKKTKDELFQIGEVSRLFHLSVSILRHYDRTGLLKPEYTDPETGYRYYSVRQFECLNTIRYLRALDMSLEQIGGFLKNRKVENIRVLLEEQKAAVQKKREELEKIEKKIGKRLERLEDAVRSRLEEIELVCLPTVRMAAVRTTIAPRSYLDLEHSLRRLEGGRDDAVVFLGKVGVGITQERLLARHYTPYDLVFILLDEEDSFSGKTILLPETRAVSLRFRGGHERAEEYYSRLMSFIEANEYRVSGFSREITMIDYGFTDDPGQFVTEIEIPVEKESSDEQFEEASVSRRKKRFPEYGSTDLRV